MSDDEILNSIQEMNLSYLLLAQALITEDRQMALFRLSFSEQVADFIAGLNTGQMLKLSNCGQLLVSLSVTDVGRLEAILANERSAGLARLHIAMVMNSELNHHKFPGASH